uniref:Uncharacterized protein n=1 Tax=Oxyrrhis marina TaxID=2969 RepID=A0A7S3UMJ5_OXYMA
MMKTTTTTKNLSQNGYGQEQEEALLLAESQGAQYVEMRKRADDEKAKKLASSLHMLECATSTVPASSCNLSSHPPHSSQEHPSSDFFASPAQPSPQRVCRIFLCGRSVRCKNL